MDGSPERNCRCELMAVCAMMSMHCCTSITRDIGHVLFHALSIRFRCCLQFFRHFGRRDPVGSAAIAAFGCSRWRKSLSYWFTQLRTTQCCPAEAMVLDLSLAVIIRYYSSTTTALFLYFCYSHTTMASLVSANLCIDGVHDRWIRTSTKTWTCPRTR